MSSKESALALALKVKQQVGDAHVEVALRFFFASLGSSCCPTPQSLEAAMNAARCRLLDGLLGSDVVSVLTGQRMATGLAQKSNLERREMDRLDVVRLSFAQLGPKLLCPPLPIVSELRSTRLALAALLGSLLGMLFAGPLFLYLLDARDTGLLLGGPLGAFFAIWGVEQASRNRFVSNLLLGSLGVATVAEAWAFVSMNPAAAIWRRVAGRNAWVRIIVYLALISLLLFTRRTVTYDRATYERSVRFAMEHWFHTSLIVLAVMLDGTVNAELDRADDKRFVEIGRRIIDLFTSPAERLADAADDVIAAARDAGFAGLDGRAVFRWPTLETESSPFCWDETMNERYNVYGNVEIGDFVKIEQPPVIFRGEVQEKGLVRKQRGK